MKKILLIALLFNVFYSLSATLWLSESQATEFVSLVTGSDPSPIVAILAGNARIRDAKIDSKIGHATLPLHNTARFARAGNVLRIIAAQRDDISGISIDHAQHIISFVLKCHNLKLLESQEIAITEGLAAYTHKSLVPIKILICLFDLLDIGFTQVDIKAAENAKTQSEILSIFDKNRDLLSLVLFAIDAPDTCQSILVEKIKVGIAAGTSHLPLLKSILFNLLLMCCQQYQLYLADVNNYVAAGRFDANVQIAEVLCRCKNASLAYRILLALQIIKDLNSVSKKPDTLIYSSFATGPSLFQDQMILEPLLRMHPFRTVHLSLIDPLYNDKDAQEKVISQAYVLTEQCRKTDIRVYVECFRSIEEFIAKAGKLAGQEDAYKIVVGIDFLTPTSTPANYEEKCAEATPPCDSAPRSYNRKNMDDFSLLAAAHETAISYALNANTISKK